ncbi:ribonucleotide reductase R1 subunit [Peniophora sp. CONT]|nr:ribonucleotide reductase R1 subunit [Peniophora sp. CONT]
MSIVRTLLALLLTCNSRLERVQKDKLIARILRVCFGLDMQSVEPAGLATLILERVQDTVSTKELDVRVLFQYERPQELTRAAERISIHSDYSMVAARLYMTALHKDTEKRFSQVVRELYSQTNGAMGITKDVYDTVVANADALDSAIIHARDLQLDWDAVQSFKGCLLIASDGCVPERPQHLLMRMAVAQHGSDIDRVIDTYTFLSKFLPTCKRRLLAGF